MTVLLQARGVRKAFGATVALAGFDVELRAGEIHALLGENGAGKSTFIKILAGLYEADEGTVDVDGPIAFIHQKQSLVPSLTVAENFGLVAGFEGRFGLVDERRLRAATTVSLARLGVDVEPDTLVSDLGVSDRALIAIARALHGEARIVVLDEPTASLPAQDVERLFGVLRALRDQGVGVVYVSHRLGEVFALCDRVTVLRDGVRQATLAVGETDPRGLATLILGAELRAAEAEVRDTTTVVVGAAPVLRLRDVAPVGMAPLDLTVARGEVVGVTGLRGAGHAELVRALFGLGGFAGEAHLGEAAYAPRSPRAALKAGVAYVSGDRTQTVAPGLTLTESMFMNPAFTRQRGWIRSHRRERAAAAEQVRELGIVPALPAAPIEQLSGGNAQKVVLARSRQADPQLLLLDDPTAGVDVRARADFHRIIKAQCAQGGAALLASSDYDEVTAVADRVLVFEGGRVVAELRGADRTPERVSAHAMGVTA